MEVMGQQISMVPPTLIFPGNTELSAKLDAIFQKCVGRNRNDRYRSLQELKDDLILVRLPPEGGRRASKGSLESHASKRASRARAARDTGFSTARTPRLSSRPATSSRASVRVTQSGAASRWGRRSSNNRESEGEEPARERSFAWLKILVGCAAVIWFSRVCDCAGTVVSIGRFSQGDQEDFPTVSGISGQCWQSARPN
jgi:hypothetical protein